MAIEILSRSNTCAEIAAELDEYFAAGVQTVWIIDPARQSAQIYHGRDEMEEIDLYGSLAAPRALPGFSVSLRELLDRAGRRQLP